MGFFATGYSKNLINKFWYEFLHGAALNELTSREINPVWFATSKIWIGSYFHGRNEGAKWSSTTSCE